MSDRRHLIGLLLGTEEDWPRAFEHLLAQIGPIEHGGETHELTTERITNEPFDLRSKPRYSLVIDRADLGEQVFERSRPVLLGAEEETDEVPAVAHRKRGR